MNKDIERILVTEEELHAIAKKLGEKITRDFAPKTEETRVAESDHIIRAYISHCWNCKNCIYDCGNVYIGSAAVIELNNIRGPCIPADMQKTRKGDFLYE